MIALETEYALFQAILYLYIYHTKLEGHGLWLNAGLQEFKRFKTYNFVAWKCNRDE